MSLKNDFRIGCAVWAFKDWVGNFYPKKSQPTNFLRLYGERMLCVEGNTTFYSVPSAEMVQRWVRNTPPEFRFCPKLPRVVTHEGPLMPQLSKALTFLKLMQGLGERLGPMMVQLPPRYSPAAFGDLRAFLSAWPTEDCAIGVEVRHLDWFKEDWAAKLTDLLVQQGVGRVLLDSRMMYDWQVEGDINPQMHSTRPKPKVPLRPEVTADFAIVRYISHPRISRNQDYLTEWVPRIRTWLAAGKQIYFFVHCPQEKQSPAIARYFQEMLEANAVPISPLPWMHLAQPPDQLSLF